MIDVGRPAKRFVKQLVGRKALKNHFKSYIQEQYTQLTTDLIKDTHEVVQSPIMDIFVN